MPLRSFRYVVGIASLVFFLVWGLTRPVHPKNDLLRIRIVDAVTHKPVPAQITFLKESGEALAFGNIIDRPGWSQGRSAQLFGHGVLAFAHGLALWNGEGSVPVGKPYVFPNPFQSGDFTTVLEPISYRIVVSRGIEYDTHEETIDLSRTRSLNVALRRSVDTTGYRSADFHVHSSPASPDAGAPGRNQVILAATTGLELLMSADHDRLTDFSPIIRGLWPRTTMAPLAGLVGVEVASIGSHFTGLLREAADEATFLVAFAKLPIADPSQYFEGFANLPGRPWISMAHGRMAYGGYMRSAHCGPWVTGDRTLPPPCNQNFPAMEILNGWSVCGSLLRETIDDWYRMLELGMVHTGTAVSDSHFSSGIVVGTPRTFVRIDDTKLYSVSTDAVVAALSSQKAIVTTGPFITVQMGELREGDIHRGAVNSANVRVRVQAANWIDVDEVNLRVGGKIVKQWNVQRTPRTAFSQIFETRVGPISTDSFITAEAQGSDVLPIYQVGVYNYDSAWGKDKCPPLPGQPAGTVPFAVTNPIFVDVAPAP